ncbi:MAG: peptide deformylase [Rhizobiaceae bacterium MnEN-MB40S]|nr:MAG: peptide deformylase [Rhizobiaceae bacterium MnEN-MB40S]
MTIKPIVLLPDPVLRKKSEDFEQVDESVRKLADDMLETMYDAPGIGLAGIQIGVPRNVVVVDCSGDDEEKAPMVLFNPKILASSDERSVYEEGCLSIPDYYAEVERPASVTVDYVDYDGARQTIEADGILATCLQHEIDHLNGVLFIDYLSKLKRDMVIRKFTKLAKSRGQPAM